MKPIPKSELPDAGTIPQVGPVAARVISGEPGMFRTYRVDQFIAATAQRNLWLTDAYFVATTSYVQALGEAARDGVDVRILVPGSSDVPALQPVVRAGYRSLVEAGIRVYEWNGSMLHAKTAVADGRWSRVGSTNLNIASWATNWELDVVIEDAAFAEAMEAMYLEDLANATEIVPGWQSRRRQARNMRSRRGQRYKKGGVRRLAAGALALSSTVGKAVGSRSLTATEASSVALIGLRAPGACRPDRRLSTGGRVPDRDRTRLARPGASHPRLPAEAAGPPETPEARAAAQACPEQGA